MFQSAGGSVTVIELDYALWGGGWFLCGMLFLTNSAYYHWDSKSQSAVMHKMR